MGCPRTNFTAIRFFLVLTVAHSLGELIILRHSPTDDGITKKLTCVSEDDGAALIWNYNSNEMDFDNGRDLFTNFGPKTPTSRNFTDCAIWNLTECFALWGTRSGWDVVNSALMPMGPVFDYRWEGLKEIVSKKSMQDQRYQYVRKVTKASGTAVFSVRGSRGINIFLCEKEDPRTGPCFWIIIGGWEGKRSAIRSCVNGAHEARLSAEGEDCVDVANVVHGNESVVDAYVWHTFILQWSSERKTIKVFNETEAEPFLEETVSQWLPVSHLSIRSEAPSRVRFHFYEYLLTEKKNAVISTTEFIHHDHEFCVEVLVGLCSECELTVTLVDSDDSDIPITSISGEENSAYGELMTWRSVRLNATLPNRKSGPVELKVVTGLMENGGKGLWAIDNFRTCKSVVGLRESTMTTHREMLIFTLPFWPTVKCQKLSYAGNTVVDSVSENHLVQVTSKENRFAVDARQGFETDRDCAVDDICSTPVPNTAANETKNVGTAIFPTARSKVKPRTEHDAYVSGESGGLLLNRKARDAPGYIGPRSNVTLELYEADPTSNTISLRLSPLHPADGGIEMYTVYVLEGQMQLDKRHYQVSNRLECTLWDNSVCFEKIKLPDAIQLKDLKSRHYKIQVNGEKGDEILVKNYTEIEQGFTDDFSSEPTNLTWTSQTHGIVTLTWGHPLLPKTKIRQFFLQITPEQTKLLQHVDEYITIDRKIDVDQDKKEYTLDLQLLTSTRYDFIVSAYNQARSGQGTRVVCRLPGGFDFEAGAELQVTNNGTHVNLTVPTLVNATVDNRIKVILKGPFTCLQNQLDEINWMYKAAVQDGKPTNLRFDANDTRVTMSDCYLNHGKTYEIKIIIIERFSNLTATLPAKSIDILTIDGESLPKRSVPGQNLIWLIIFPVLVIFLLALFIWRRKLSTLWRQTREAGYLVASDLAPTTNRTTNSTVSCTTNNAISQFREAGRPSTRKVDPKQPREPSYLDIIPPASTTTRLTNSMVLAIADNLKLQPGAGENLLSVPLYAVPNEHDSCCVSMEYFEEYAKEAIASGRLYSQFMLLREGLTKSCEYGGRPENVPKNRYRNLIAYDDTRVVLEKIPGDPYSDYINASYIKGYKRERAYIATQGPKPNTVNDFWRMVWQEEVRVICMLMNVIEDTETNYEKYWPDVGTRVKYGDVFVSNTDQQVFADYTFRTFKLTRQRDTRTVTHLHYTGWPSLGVPTYSQSLVEYLKKLERTQTGSGPVVVHSRTGNGRTGTIILCDICLRQAIAEKEIDVTAVITRMRDSRANMVETLQQYVLAHVIISERMVFRPTQIPCTGNLAKDIQKMRMQLPSDIQRLNDGMWQEQALRSLADQSPASDKLPGLDPDRPGVVYSNLLESQRNFFNAVIVDGVKTKAQYLASYSPPPFTIPGFWASVSERNIKLIIILQCSDPRDPTCCDILPDESIVLPVPQVRVENQTSLDEADYVTTEKLLFTDTSEEDADPRYVTALTCKGWGRGQHGKPPKPEALVSLWRASEKIPRKEGQTLVLCHDGITGCGLYLALSFLLERMAVERECDIISAVRSVRRSKPEFVQQSDQFEYLYDAAETYAEYFQSYANFT